MKTATVTYVAPVGDSKVVEMGGMTFYDGKPVDINSVDNAAMFEKLQTNAYFDFSMGKDEPDTVKPKVKRGRPSNADIAAAKAAAEQADQEHRDAEARAKAAQAEADAVAKAARGEGDDMAPVKGATSTGSTNRDTLADAPSSSSGIALGGQSTPPAAASNPVGLAGTSPLPAAPSPLSEPTKIDDKK